MVEGKKVHKNYLLSKNNSLRQKQDVWNQALSDIQKELLSAIKEIEK